MRIIKYFGAWTIELSISPRIDPLWVNISALLWNSLEDNDMAFVFSEIRGAPKLPYTVRVANYDTWEKALEFLGFNVNDLVRYNQMYIDGQPLDPSSKPGVNQRVIITLRPSWIQRICRRFFD